MATAEQLKAHPNKEMLPIMDIGGAFDNIEVERYP